MIEPELLSKIKLLAPGTRLRNALDDMVMAGIGSLIFFADDLKKYESITQGGFLLDSAFYPEKLYELAKMDGAIVLDADLNKILAANVHLVPDPLITTNETGMRHRTAERVAKQTGQLVLAVSKRRNVITLYYKDYKYPIHDINLQITRVSQALNTLQSHRENLDKMLAEIEAREFQHRVNLADAAELINRGVEIIRMRADVEPVVIEIGVEGRLAAVQLQELTDEIEDLTGVLIMDYAAAALEETEAAKVLEKLRGLKDLGSLAVARELGYEVGSLVQMEETNLAPRGYRMLKYVARIPMNISRNVVKAFKNLSRISTADVAELKRVEGVGKKRAQTIVNSINALRNRG